MSERDNGFMAGLSANTRAIESLAARLEREDEDRLSAKLLDLLEFREAEIEDLGKEIAGLRAQLQLMRADRNYSEDDK